MYEYKCTVAHIVDGDTVDILIDLGFKTFVLKRVRFDGINAPESRTKNKREKVHGLYAKAWVKRMFAQATTITVLTKQEKGKYGRLVGRFILEIPELDEPVDLTDTMLKHGYGYEYSGGRRWAYSTLLRRHPMLKLTSDEAMKMAKTKTRK